MMDVLVLGAGPAGLSLAAELGQRGLSVQGLSLTDPADPLPNTYGIWVDELEALGHTEWLSHRWTNCVVQVRGRTLPLQREYGLIDRQRVQTHWLTTAERHGVQWLKGAVAQCHTTAQGSEVITQAGDTLSARLVVDATGHQPVLVQRRAKADVAYQAAYGIVGRFSQPPIEADHMVFMDFRDDHLSSLDQQQGPPTFLYAMDLGDGCYFVEETSLAQHPAIAMDTLKHRLHLRLRHRGVEVSEIHHEERCLFPMNLPLPDLNQPVVGFGGAASMVHPASGYLFGALLRRGPMLANAIVDALNQANLTTPQVAQRSWDALWPQDRLRKHYLYLFGLENLMDFSPTQINHFFGTFFQLDTKDWAGFLADGLTLPQVVQSMIGLFGQAPNDVRWGLMTSVTRHGSLLQRTITL